MRFVVVAVFGLLIGQARPSAPPPAVKVTVSARGIQPGEFVVVGIDLDVKPGSYPVAIDVGSGKTTEHVTHTLLVRSKAFPTRQLKVDDAFVNPPASAQERIAQDTRDL